MSEFFFALTPEAVLAAVEAGGWEPSGHVTPLMCLENRVFDVRLEDASHVVVKFYRPGRWSREAILAEHAFLAELREAEVPVCAPLAFDDGRTLHRAGEIHYAVWPRTGGRAPDELGDEQIDVVGRLIARIHNVGAAGEAPDRPTLGERTAREALVVLEDGFLPPTCVDRYASAVDELVQIYDDWSRDVPLHRIHGDCHAGNLLHGDAGWFFLDFDDFVVGPAVHDVWMLLPGRDAEGARQRERLVGAYRQFRPFEERWLRLVEPLRAFRFIWYAAWIARRWEDPAFPSAFPHFGTPSYWETETHDLEQLLEGLLGGPAPPGRGAPADAFVDRDDDAFGNR